MKKSHAVIVALVALVVLVGLVFAWFRTGAATMQCPHGTTAQLFKVELVVTPSPNSTIVSSKYPEVCPGDTVEWTVKNNCRDCGNGKVKVTIDDRSRRHEASCDEVPNLTEDKDCFKKKYLVIKCKPAHAGVPFGATETIGQCEVKGNAQNGCYKYSLKGTFDIDPEVEVQGGLPFEPGPEPQASPSASGPSPQPHVSPAQ